MRMPQHYVMDETPIGEVVVAAHEYTDRSFETASAWAKYDVPEQTVKLVVRHWNDGTRYVGFHEDAVLQETYYVNSLSTAICSPGGGAWSTSVNHKTGLNKPETIGHSERIGYGKVTAEQIARSAEYFKSVMERWGHYQVNIF